MKACMICANPALFMGKPLPGKFQWQGDFNGHVPRAPPRYHARVLDNQDFGQPDPA